MKFTRRHTLGLIGATTAMGLATPNIAMNKKIKVGALRFTSHSGSFIAKEREYFADNGLDVELVFFQASQPMAVAIASKDIDYAVTAITGGLANLAEKGAIKIIGGALKEEAGLQGMKYLVSDVAFQNGVKAPRDLDGMRYGITQTGSSLHYQGSKMAAAENISLSYVPLQKVGTLVGAITSGQIDAFSIVPHIALPIAGGGNAHIIGNISDYIPDYQITVVFTSTHNAEFERLLTSSFLNAFTTGVDDYAAVMIDQSEGQEGIDDMVDIIHKYVYTDRERAKAAPSIINGTMRLSKGAALNLASVRDQLEWFQSEGLVDPGVTLNMLVDESYVEIIDA